MNAPSGSSVTTRPKRIVVRGVNWLGDAVMTTPALLRLREVNPDAFIALLAPEKLADLWMGHPAINIVLPFAPKESASSVAGRVRDLRFQVGLTLPNSFRSALELWMARVPNRIGYAGQLRRWLLTVRIPRPSGMVVMRKRSASEILRLTDAHWVKIDPAVSLLASKAGNATARRRLPERYPATAHHIHHYLQLVTAFGASAAPIAPQLFVSATEIERCRRRLQIAPNEERPIFGLNPGAEYGPAKRWPVENFIGAARELQQRTRCRWLILGGKGDIELADQVTAGIRAGRATQAEAETGRDVVNLAGATSLRELCAVLKVCRVLLTNDSGPMHVAAALGTPVVALFGSTAPELTGPGLPGDPRHRLLRIDVPCAPCFQRQCPIDFRCLRGISIADAVEAVLELTKCSDD